MNKQIFPRWGLIILALVLILFLSPLNIWWIQLYKLLPNKLLSVIVDLLRISLFALTFAGLLAPFEALAWWAGWYGKDQSSQTVNSLQSEAATISTTPPLPSAANHYIVYLDGIGKSSFEESGLVEQFMARLSKSLPRDCILIKEIIPYSVINLPLTIDRPLAAFWQWVNRSKIKGLKVLILLRNMLQVAVSVDSRYGKVFNRGTAQVIMDRLLDQGYQPGSGTLITLIGYSGGGQISLGSLPYLKRVLAAPIEMISLAGVLSGNTEVVLLEHLYHVVGEKDRVARFVPWFFPQRWSLISWSNWNLAKSRGEISFISLGAVGHDGAGGPLDDRATLADGRTHLSQTLEIITQILTRKDGIEPFPTAVPEPVQVQAKTMGNYHCYMQADFNRPSYYPVKQSVPDSYRPVGTWIGRLILPASKERSHISGVYLEVYHAPQIHQDLVGKIVNLKWSDRRDVQAYINQIKFSIHFSPQAYESMNQGAIHPWRLNYWRLVEPLESLAGARPYDDVIVTLGQSVTVEKEQDFVSLAIAREPILITGRFYGLVTILGQTEENPDYFRVRHYNAVEGKFSGREEIVYIPQVIRDCNGVFPATTNKITQSPLNPNGWYIYGALNHDHIFTVRAISPRRLWQLQPEQIISGQTATIDYIHNKYWQGTVENKGKIDSILLNPRNLPEKAAIEQYQAGDRLLILHTYGGIGGKKKEFAPFGIFFGHFAFGLARVVRDPISQELRFKNAYGQVYTQNIDGIIASSLDWTAYMGDRQFGWLGTRPVVDIIVKLDVFEEYNFGENLRFPLNTLAYELDKMMAIYRTGNGTGATFVGPANSCVQDACQALYHSINMTLGEIESNPEIQHWLQAYPEHPETKRLQRLVALNESFKKKLIPWATIREDWRNPSQSLIGTSLADRPITTIANALTSWRSLLPRLANDQLAKILLEHGASLWLLRTNQVGGWDEDIEPIAPTKLWI